MVSFKRLVRSNRQGWLGSMLVKRFEGERGRTDPQADSNFLIGFASGELVPSVAQLEKAVADFYSQLGYRVEVLKDSPVDMFEAFVFCPGGRKETNSIYVLITTRYPLAPGEKKDCLRVTTEINR